MRINKHGQVLRRFSVEVPAEIHRKLELEKHRSGIPMGALLLKWASRNIQKLPPVHVPNRIES